MDKKDLKRLLAGMGIAGLMAGTFTALHIQSTEAGENKETKQGAKTSCSGMEKGKSSCSGHDGGKSSCGGKGKTGSSCANGSCN